MPKKNTKQNNNAPARKSHMIRNAVLVVLVAILAGAAAFYYIYLSGGIANAVLAAVQNPSQLNSILMQKFSQSNEMAVSYTGTIKGNVTLPSGDPHVNALFDIHVVKHYNDTRFIVSINGAGYISSNLTNLSVVAISKNNEKSIVACYNANDTGYICQNVTGSSLQTTLLSIFNITKISNTNINEVKPSYADGQPCWVITGDTMLTSRSLAQVLGSNSNDVLMAFDTCLSPTFYVPLYASMTMVGLNGNSLVIFVSGLNVTQATSESNVTALPGPLK